MRKGLLAAAIALAAGAAVWWWSRPLPVPRNVLLITLDTFRADRLGCYGSDRGLTPHLDALADDGAIFVNACTPSPLTAPSHATMLTGRYSVSHGLRNNGSDLLSQEEILLSEILRERGFQTAAIVSALVLASQFGLNQGWDLYYEKDIVGSERAPSLWSDQRRGDMSVDRAIAWLKAEADRPFLLWVHLFDAHEPYEAPSPWKERFARTPYDGEIAFVDEQVGRLVRQVRDLDHYDDSLIIVAGDHGEGLGEHGELYHGIFLYQTTMRVPLILRVPGGPRGVVVRDLASTLDIAPTVLEALGIPAPHDVQGVSLLPAAARGGRVPARSLYLETIYASASYGWAAARAILRAPWKLVDLPQSELYDTSRDPGENQNLHAAQPARAAELRAEYERLREELEDTAREAEAAAVDDETRDRLFSLGYVGGQQSRARQEAGRDPKELAFMITPLNIAVGLLRERKFADAEEVFRKALEVDPDNKIALLKVAQALVAQGRLDEAVPFFERAIGAYPDVEELYRIYGWALLRAGRLREAESVFDRALASMPRSAHMHLMLGYARLLRKEWTDAEIELDLAIRINPRLSWPYYLLAICRVQAGDDTAALAAIQDYLRRSRDVESLLADPHFQELLERPDFQGLLRQYL